MGPVPTLAASQGGTAPSSAARRRANIVPEPPNETHHNHVDRLHLHPIKHSISDTVIRYYCVIL